jgi:hypothetical protein
LTEVDAEFEKEFGETVGRHEKAFDDLIRRHRAYMQLLNEHRKVADQVAESSNRVDAAYGTIEVMDIALSDRRNPGVAVPIVRHFSPRSRSPIAKASGPREGR